MNWNIAVFAVVPYVALAVFVVGHVWRWRSDQFGWTTRTSELSEKRWLLVASPVFHTGLLLAIVGHLAGLLIPPAATEAMGIPNHVYHAIAVGVGTFAGLLVVVGLVLLILRRFILKTRLRLVTRPGDVVVYLLLGLQILLGMIETIAYSLFSAAPGFDYRESISVWFRSVFYANPAVDLMASAPLVFQIHAVLGFALFAVWPFSRLVHVWSVPVGYLTRPPVVYRANNA